MDEGMGKKWKWIAAFFLCAGVLVSNYLYSSGKISFDVKKIVYSSEDLTFMRNLLREIFDKESKDTIAVSSDPINQELLTFVQVKPYYKGYLLTYEEAVPLIAVDHGLVVYTGYNKDTGKTISVYYEDNTTVTYGNVDSFSLLPYTSIERGSIIGKKEAGDLYIQVEKDGNILNLEETLTWMKEHMRP
ncbi:M23 family metallopeptidase [Ureibacillus terrenus]|uniref:M23 family metallopeptidase n=1 Tax=Ureibacillus terrenus TaxID=118246 RepID=UPI002E1F9EF8|nr:M23 family metallopeptidase [Ureibacillus terrenus]